MSTATRAVANPNRLAWTGLAVVAGWGLVYVGARAFLDVELQQRLNFAPWVRVTAALIPVLPTAVFLWCIVAQVRSLDEMQRKIHLEALAIAYPLAILLLMTLGLLQLAIDLPPQDWSYRQVWFYLPLFYFIGLAIAWRRYR